MTNKSSIHISTEGCNLSLKIAQSFVTEICYWSVMSQRCDAQLQCYNNHSYNGTTNYSVNGRCVQKLFAFAFIVAVRPMLCTVQ